MGVMVAGLSGLNLVSKLYFFYEGAARWLRAGSFRRRYHLRRALQEASTWDAWRDAATALDDLDGKQAWRDDKAGFHADDIQEAARQFRTARAAGDVEEVVRLLRSSMQRNHLHIDDETLHCECR